MYPVWAKTARGFSLRLDRLQTAKGRFLAKKMREFVVEFEAWESDLNPHPDEKLRRRKIVTEYMSCYRDALEALANP